MQCLGPDCDHLECHLCVLLIILMRTVPFGAEPQVCAWWRLASDIISEDGAVCPLSILQLGQKEVAPTGV